MNFERKLALAKKNLFDKGVWKTATGNRLYDTLQYLGIKFRPMYYFSFLRVYLPTSIFFGLAFGISTAVTSDEIDFC